ncbi:DUF2470 domain-containing protein [Leptolyngbya sp. CCNP1308]|uniref:DUF2470 domain-containing protein n=1 Tax=Leptolyngbya sp. CCNP1308 TaxID=3110255 RepID=UPI002B20CDA5|nr:DUF2470 domain-containing protein [Leptolyngbya sp. CCNP1308]MEA5451391.1 DUF2470 domain-containing protein [Leptolyngbya sp. CCNP1308]
MAEPITPVVSDRICKHMNDDHTEAVLLYATAYGNQPTATAAVMESVDPEGMTLAVTVDGDQTAVRVPFDHTLEGAEDAHHTLVAMLKQAKARA